jgi:hypothetical protein
MVSETCAFQAKKRGVHHLVCYGLLLTRKHIRIVSPCEEQAFEGTGGLPTQGTLREHPWYQQLSNTPLHGTQMVWALFLISIGYQLHKKGEMHMF